MIPIPENTINILMLHEGVWQNAKLLPIDEEDPSDEPWFEGTEIGCVPMSEIQDWKLLIKLDCMVCNKEFLGTEPVMCCSGIDCGCMGLPSDPIVCSNDCYYGLIKSKE